MKLSVHKTFQRDFFLYLLVIITLYITVGSFIHLLFQYIDVLFPDKLNYYFSPYQNIRFAMSMLIVVFPIYLALTWFLRKDMVVHPEKREFGFRKALLYFTLFVASLVMIVDLVRLLNNFLQGDLTLRFSLKVLIVFFVAASVFSYYLWDLRRETKKNSRPSKFLAYVVSLIVVASIVSGFFIVGSPMTQRKLRFDEQRVSELQVLQQEIINYWTYKEKLPPLIEVLKNDLSGFMPPNDPETNAAYEYMVTGELTFRLCATFNLETPDYQKSSTSYGHAPYGPYNQSWIHEAGRFCFDREIDPDLYRNNAEKPPRL